MVISAARRNRVKELWLGLPETWRTEFASAFHTFIPVFFVTMAGFFQSAATVEWTKEALISLIVATFAAALRAGFKALSVWFFSRLLPDPKDG